MAFLQGYAWEGITAIVILQILAQIWAAGHAIVSKRDPRSAAGWTAVILLSPFAGPLAYWLLGINRLRRKARRKMAGHPNGPGHHGARHKRTVLTCDHEGACSLYGLNHLSHKVTHLPLLAGNSVRPLINGEQAFPAMLKAIANAKHTIGLCTYIFDHDESGLEFSKALIAASERGVDVRVLVDALGVRYSFPATIWQRFKGTQVKWARHLETRWPWHYHYSQLRNHRKILVIDGHVAFTGGMNIRHDHCIQSAKHPTADIHFEMHGPIVRELQEVFLDDWSFANKHHKHETSWSANTAPAGGVECRVVADGPDEQLDRLRWVMMGALSMATKSVRIMSPYFLPDRSLTDALSLAAMRGVNVEIIMPVKNNLRMVQWATNSMLWQVLETGCRVYFSKGPFDHSKLMVVDDYWSFIGSTNWDARSLRLNFELNVECYQSELARTLNDIFEEKRRISRPVTLQEMDARPFWQRLRDGACRLFTPYL